MKNSPSQDGFTLSAEDGKLAKDAFEETAGASENAKIPLNMLHKALQKAGVELPPYTVRKITDAHKDWSDGVPFDDFLKIVAEARSKNPSESFKVLSKSQCIREDGVAGHDSFHSIRTEEKVAFCEWINNILRDDEHLTKNGYLPLDPNSDDVFAKSSDGVLLTKLINKEVPGTLDERRLNYGKNKNLMKVKALENNNMALSGCKALGCTVVNIGAEEIYLGKPHLILALLWQVIRIGLLQSVNLDFHPSMSKLLEPGEDPNEALKESPEKILIRWVNYHLARTECPRRLTNFTHDIKDSVIYTHLLHQISPREARVTLKPLKLPNDLDRASAMLSEAEKIGCRQFLKPGNVINGNAKLNLAFVANLFNNHHSMNHDKVHLEYNPGWVKLLREGETIDDLYSLPENEFLKRWINNHLEGSLNTDRRVQNLASDLDDGIIYYNLLREISPSDKPVSRDVIKPPSKEERARKIVEIPMVKDIAKECPISPKDIAEGNEDANVPFLCHLFNKYHSLTQPEPELRHTPDVAVLLRPGEEIESLKKLPAREFLKRWVNYHLSHNAQQPAPGPLTTISDLEDGRIYASLLNAIAKPEDGISVQPIPDSKELVQKVLKESGKLGCGSTIKYEHVTEGVPRENVAFLAELYNSRPGLAAKPTEQKLMLPEAVKRAEELAGTDKSPDIRSLKSPADVTPILESEYVGLPIPESPGSSKKAERADDVVKQKDGVALPPDTDTTRSRPQQEPPSSLHGKPSVVELVFPVDVTRLRKPYESHADTSRLQPEEFLKRWVNYHMQNSPSKRRLLSPTDDLKDSEIFAHLLVQIAPETKGVSLKPLSEQSATRRAELVLEEAKKLDLVVLPSTDQILSGELKANMKFLAEMFNRYNALDKEPDLVVPPEIDILLKPGEELSTVPTKNLLIRWANYQLENSQCERRIEQFPRDTTDGEIYTYLIKEVAPPNSGVTLRPMAESGRRARAAKLLEEAAKIGCARNIKPDDITRGRERPNMLLLARLLSKYPNLKRNSEAGSATAKGELKEPVETLALQCPPEAILLLEPNEKEDDLTRLGPQELLLRWVNYHLARSPCKRRMTNFTTDIQDAEIYCHLMQQIVPKSGQVSQLLEEKSPDARAEKVKSEAENLGVLVKLETIIYGDRNSNIKFVADLFNKHNGLSKPEVDGGPEKPVSDDRQPLSSSLLTPTPRQGAGRKESRPFKGVLQCPKGAVLLLKPTEKKEDLAKLDPQDLLKRWVNYHLENSPCKRRMTNFTSDINDSEIYSHLIQQIAPKDVPVLLVPIEEESDVNRAEKIAIEAQKLGVTVLPANIVAGNRKPNILFVAELFNRHNGLPKPPKTQFPSPSSSSGERVSMKLEIPNKEAEKDKGASKEKEVNRQKEASKEKELTKDNPLGTAGATQSQKTIPQTGQTVSLKYPPQAAILLKPGETMNDIQRLDPQQFLLRWVNYHLANTKCKRQINNFSSDIQDVTAYSYLLQRIAPSPEVEKLLEEKAYENRAAKVKIEARKLGVSVKSEMIISGDQHANIKFVADLFNTKHSLPDRLPDKPSSEPESPRSRRDVGNLPSKRSTREAPAQQSKRTPNKSEPPPSSKQAASVRPPQQSKASTTDAKASKTIKARK